MHDLFLGLTQIFFSVKAPENVNCAITAMADTDSSLAWVKFGEPLIEGMIPPAK